MEVYYRAHYFEAIDLLVSCIKGQFDQPGYKVCSKLESVLLNAASGKKFDAKFDEVMKLCGCDFDSTNLKSQLEILRSHFPSSSEPVRLSSIKEFLVNLGES